MEIHHTLPRYGPGSNASTGRAFALLPAVPAAPRILDVGCGPGMQTLELARLSGGKVIGLDIHQPCLDDLAAGAVAAGLADRVQAINGSMDALPFAPEAFDVIWAEGSLFIMGWDKALPYLKDFLKPGGFLAASDLTWLRDDPPSELLRFWKEVGADIMDTAGYLALFAAAGYEMVGHFVAPASDWLDGYYGPEEKRLALLRAKYRGNEAAMAVVETVQAEIDMYRKFGEYYGYLFYVARKPR